jgi:hypothetical protein
MACCGQRRRQVSRATPIRRVSSPPLPNSLNRYAAQPRTTPFQYVGKTALTAVGSVSGRHYRFSHPGAIVEVDLRDRASLALVPYLRQV